MKIRSKKKIAEQLDYDTRLSEQCLADAIKSTNEDDKNRNLRARNIIMERVYTLKWVLGELDEL